MSKRVVILIALPQGKFLGEGLSTSSSSNRELYYRSVSQDAKIRRRFVAVEKKLYKKCTYISGKYFLRIAVFLHEEITR